MMESFQLTETAQTSFADEELITMILNGEIGLYEHIMRKYNQRMYRICLNIIHDEIEVEDIMQNAYVKAYENLHGFKGKSKFSTWLLRILINESLLWLQRNKRKIDFQKSVLQENISDFTNHKTNTPAQQMMNNELKKILEDAIAQLSPKHRIVFVMREIENMSTAETSDCLRISQINVKVRLNRAKEMLRDILMKSEYKELYAFHLNRCDRVVKGVMEKISGNNIYSH
jgi:RNA polymerase sigma factor (sigma-70 family)